MLCIEDATTEEPNCCCIASPTPPCKPLDEWRDETCWGAMRRAAQRGQSMSGGRDLQVQDRLLARVRAVHPTLAVRIPAGSEKAADVGPASIFATAEPTRCSAIVH